MALQLIVQFLLALAVLNYVDSNLGDYQRYVEVKKYYTKKHKYNDGVVRLVNGRTAAEGNVEVFHDGRWGSVCDDEFDEAEARVVCRQLGYRDYQRVTRDSYFGQARKKFWIDDVFCGGSEYELAQCKFSGWGNHDCTPQEAAGVVCQQTNDVKSNWTTNYSTKKSSYSSYSYKQRIQDMTGGHLSIRLTGGRVREEGQVEIRVGYSDWGVICGDGWSLREANVVCRQLGLGHATYAAHGHFYSRYSHNVLLTDVECRGDEASLMYCTHTKSPKTCTNHRNGGAGVICTREMADLVIDAGEIERSAYLQDRSLHSLQCAMEENCLASSAYRIKSSRYDWYSQTRRLLRFTARIVNTGTADFRPAVPKHLWQFHQCHMHFHSMEVFATFDVFDGSGRKVAEGHKASFCLEDNQCLRGTHPEYACANFGEQGISVNCTDIYRHDIDCQWVDITDLKPGHYTLRVAVNPEFKVGEMSFENNAADCALYYSESSARVYNCRLTRP
nr:PREDICTED: lysyl oxidase homolog 3-like isoform X2 [Bemisia tabaci]XP_018909899.1 PREDICTED: lysyl oxidase homolog 3-like isoform X2 [Bemisia tabaci]XP_018909900.1 PREDICTED: lysyl oxidase homolog 3-like isoform X2 [Bemisia tabaci]XP_018909901.1 PREDICTED: lysyl oxidase homolog 3-like isoform X2 [Bemisia tabaci]XP_018909902.1 PREDICTED: lysyl oxidase homolog 3-like isoform X2 [Bemisia tabaci]XP_018909903.1 PREDICTED: lysyl oxidase homolog 3-like isoform X2 [Bemisia tabaci]